LAPGIKMISLYTGNKYGTSFGTSLACAVVSGVAALVWSYYPELTAAELKNILLTSTTKYDELNVTLPNLKSPEKTKVPFSALSSTGGVINALEALKMAEKVSKAKTNK